MKLILGKSGQDEFKILGKDDVDITEHFSCTKFSVSVEHNGMTMGDLEVYMEGVDAELGSLSITIKDIDYIKLAQGSIEAEQLALHDRVVFLEGAMEALKDLVHSKP